MLVIIILINYKESFTQSTKINKLDFDKIKILEINKKNINTNNPLICFDNFCLYLIDNIYSLFDKTTNLTHTSYHKDTKESSFVYLNTIIKLYPKNSKNVCVLGFGLGGLPLALSKNENIKTIDCVDINNKMFETYKTINNNPPKKINYYLNDVNDFIKYSDQKYDMIVDDTFGTDKVIVDYSLIKNMLNPNGVLYINIINYETVKTLSLELEKIYSNVSHQRVNFNYLITCSY
jgi:2-polyprenyl-3-methyl-5-hydroxy-6-metoxy-1,4-benzoquinol methylase